MMTLGGSPTGVAAPPMLEKMTSQMRMCLGSSSMTSQSLQTRFRSCRESALSLPPPYVFYSPVVFRDIPRITVRCATPKCQYIGVLYLPSCPSDLIFQIAFSSWSRSYFCRRCLRTPCRGWERHRNFRPFDSKEVSSKPRLEHR